MSITTELTDYIIDNDLVPAGTIFQYAEPAFEECKSSVTEDIIYSLNVSSGQDNPKYVRGDYFIRFRVRGRSKCFTKPSDDACTALYNELLGLPNIQVGNSIYFNFRSSEAPRFSGYYEGSEPIFTFSLLITRESTVDEGNRVSF